MSRRTLALLSATLGLGWALTAHGDGLATLCQNDLKQDRQPDFADGGFSKLQTVQVTGNPAVLRLNTNLDVLNDQRIVLPFDQNVSITYVYESGGAGWALGWMYADDLVKRGYMDASGNLLDKDGDGIDDFHEDLYNLSTSRYIGTFRKCGASPPTFDWNGNTFAEPELATDSCTNTVLVNQSIFGILADGGTGNLNATVVGKKAGSSPDVPTVEWTDNGLYPHIPNLLEPADPANNALGLGHLIFLNAEDDSNNTSWGNMAAAKDVVTLAPDGVPDYDVSAYDSNGRPLPNGVPNPDPGVTLNDRTVNLGMIQGGREIIFYLVVAYNAANGGSQVYPCLAYLNGTCSLYVNGPINVWFSRTDLNMDENTKLTSPAATRDIGCGYPSSCTVDGGTYQGWLDQATLDRLSAPDGGFNLVLPHEVASVVRPATNKMPHVLAGAPSTDPFRWILGFEDLSGGGDRDFNDVVFQINKSNGGTATSGIESSDISPADADDFTISNIRFSKDDDLTYQSGGPANACAGPPAAAIDYYVAVDCKVCAGGICAANPNPSWTRVPLPAGNPAQVTFNVLDLGFTGSQLCWQARLSSPNAYCQPTIKSVDVGYQAVRAGSFSRSSPSTVANAFVYGTYETPGQSWTGPYPTKMPAASTRNYDGRKDLGARGHLYLKTIYDPEKPDVTRPVLRWDGAGKLATDYASADPAGRRLLTVNASGAISDLRTVNAAEDLLLPGTDLCKTNGGKYVYDLNQDGICTTADRDFLKDWLYGWEDNQAPAPSGVHRAWTMGGVSLSTPAVVGPPTFPAWFYTTTGVEKAQFQLNYMSSTVAGTAIATRGTYAYVSTDSGVLHAFKAGAYSPGTADSCVSGAGQQQYRGFFKETGSCLPSPQVNPRDYGNGSERFAYLPRGLLGSYVNNYVGTTVTGASGASLSASPAVADVDLGGLSNGTAPWTTSATPRVGAKTLLVSASGKGQSLVYALDITQPDVSSYPVAQWEWDMNSVAASFASAQLANSSVQLPDTNGTRHAPVIARVDFSTDPAADCGNGRGSCRKWVAAVASDYVPGTGTSGAVYLLDLATGLPVTVNGKQVGVIPLELGEGISGEPTWADGSTGDGTSDVLYVASTSGRVYRINVNAQSLNNPLGQRIPPCLIASAPLSVGGSQGYLQEIHSGVVARAYGQTNGKQAVEFFVGTADNPDDPNDAVASNYYVLAYTDTDPLGACPAAPLDATWVNRLDPGQRVWGGIALDQKNVYVATAVGSSADACNLDTSTSGKYYSFTQGDGSPNAGSGKDLGGHALSAPVIYDGHVLTVNVLGQATAYGDAAWNNKTNFTPATPPKVILWDVSPQSKLPK